MIKRKLIYMLVKLCNDVIKWCFFVRLVRRLMLQSVDHLNTKLEEENHALMMQLQALLNQNQELLTQTMDSKDHFHNEQRAYR